MSRHQHGARVRDFTGLEEAIANGSAPTLAGGASLETRLLAVAYADRERISGIGEDGRVY